MSSPFQPMRTGRQARDFPSEPSNKVDFLSSKLVLCLKNTSTSWLKKRSYINSTFHSKKTLKKSYKKSQPFRIGNGNKNKLFGLTTFYSTTRTWRLSSIFMHNLGSILTNFCKFIVVRFISNILQKMCRLKTCFGWCWCRCCVVDSWWSCEQSPRK